MQIFQDTPLRFGKKPKHNQVADQMFRPRMEKLKSQQLPDIAALQAIQA